MDRNLSIEEIIKRFHIEEGVQIKIVRHSQGFSLDLKIPVVEGMNNKDRANDIIRQCVSRIDARSIMDQSAYVVKTNITEPFVDETWRSEGERYLVVQNAPTAMAHDQLKSDNQGRRRKRKSKRSARRHH